MPCHSHWNFSAAPYARGSKIVLFTLHKGKFGPENPLYIITSDFSGYNPSSLKQHYPANMQEPFQAKFHRTDQIHSYAQCLVR